jgi:hypothetical protein
MPWLPIHPGTQVGIAPLVAKDETSMENPRPPSRLSDASRHSAGQAVPHKHSQTPLPCVDLVEGASLICCCECLPVTQPEVAAAPVTVPVDVPVEYGGC